MKFFISYCHGDRPACQAIVKALDDLGCQVEYDRGIGPGANWSAWVDGKIDESDCFVALLSSSSVSSAQCKREWDVALGRRREAGRPLIVPLRVGSVDSLGPFAATHVEELQEDQLPKLIRAIRKQVAVGIDEFWGAAPFTQPVRLVVATREATRPIEWKTFARVPAAAQPEGPAHWLATQDIRAAVYLANALSRFSGHGIVVLHDHEARSRADSGCTISLGLGFNQLTFDRMDQFDGLYRIHFEPSPTGALELTDYFALGDDQPLRPKDGWDVALLARTVLPQPGGRRSVHFVCAGRTANGTACAGYFLAEQWQELADLYWKHDLSLNDDSVAVALWHRTAGDGQPEKDLHVRLTNPRGKVLFNVRRAFGIPPRRPVSDGSATPAA